MSLIIFIIVVLIVMALLIWAVGFVGLIPQPINNLIIVLIIVLAALAIANRAGIFSG